MKVFWEIALERRVSSLREQPVEFDQVRRMGRKLSGYKGGKVKGRKS